MKKYKHLEVAIFSQDLMDDDQKEEKEEGYAIKLGMLRMQEEFREGITEESIRELANKATEEYIRMLKHNKVIR